MQRVNVFVVAGATL